MVNKLFDVEKVLSLHNSGMYAKDIAIEVGCDYGTVKNYLREFGYTPRKKRIEITEDVIADIVRLAKEEKKLISKSLKSLVLILQLLDKS